MPQSTFLYHAIQILHALFRAPRRLLPTVQNRLLVVVDAAPPVHKEKLLLDPKSEGGLAKRVLVSDRPDGFRPASGKVGQKILALLSSGPKYPAEIARALGTHHQTVYYLVGRLEKAGLVTKVRSESIRGGEANLFAVGNNLSAFLNTGVKWKSRYQDTTVTLGFRYQW